MASAIKPDEIDRCLRRILEAGTLNARPLPKYRVSTASAQQSFVYSAIIDLLASSDIDQKTAVSIIPRYKDGLRVPFFYNTRTTNQRYVHTYYTYIDTDTCIRACIHTYIHTSRTIYHIIVFLSNSPKRNLNTEIQKRDFFPIYTTKT